MIQRRLASHSQADEFGLDASGEGFGRQVGVNMHLEHAKGLGEGGGVEADPRPTRHPAMWATYQSTGAEASERTRWAGRGARRGPFRRSRKPGRVIFQAWAGLLHYRTIAESL